MTLYIKSDGKKYRIGSILSEDEIWPILRKWKNNIDEYATAWVDT